MQIAYFLSRLNVGQSILVHVLVSWSIWEYFLGVHIFFLLVKQRVLKVWDWYSVSFEEPRLKALDERSFKLCDIVVQLYNKITESLNFFDFIFVIPFGDFLLLDEFELFLINDVLVDFLLGFVFLFLLELKLNLLEVILFLLCSFSELLDFFFLLLELLDVPKNRVVELKTRRWLEVLIGLIFVYVNDFSLNDFFARTLFWLFVFLLKLFLRNVY